MSGHPPSWRLRAFSVVTAALSFFSQAVAQTPPPSNPNRTVNLNYVYAAELGFGGYSLAGLSASVYTLPLSDTLHNLPYEGWALKLMLPIQGGLYSFRATDSGRSISIDQQSLSVVPGWSYKFQLANGPC